MDRDIRSSVFSRVLSVLAVPQRVVRTKGLSLTGHKRATHDLWQEYPCHVGKQLVEVAVSVVWKGHAEMRYECRRRCGNWGWLFLAVWGLSVCSAD